MKPYEKGNTLFAKLLRGSMTPWERKLWYEFLHTYPVRFQRQKPIGAYIVDFYCAKASLAVELDGGGHFEAAQAEKDAARTKALQVMGLEVLRIPNLEIDRSFYSVCEAIDLATERRLQTLGRRDPKPPSDEGGGTAQP